MKLEDGTQVEVTADHPMRTMSDVCSPMKKTCDLQPGKDEVMVTRTLPVRLESIQSWQDSVPRVSVTLAQSMRFSMFVRGLGRQTAAVALESADYLAHELQVKNGFVDYLDSKSGIESHAASAPPAVSSFHLRPVLCNSSDGCSSLSGIFEVVLTSPSDENGANLSAYRDLKVSGCASIGSVRHNDFACVPCRFEHNHQKDPANAEPCRNFQFCTFCHAEHDDEYWKRHQLQKKYDKKKSRRRGRQLGSISDDETRPAVSL